MLRNVYPKDIFRNFPQKHVSIGWRYSTQLERSLLIYLRVTNTQGLKPCIRFRYIYYSVYHIPLHLATYELGTPVYIRRRAEVRRHDMRCKYRVQCTRLSARCNACRWVVAVVAVWTWVYTFTFVKCIGWEAGYTGFFCT